MSAPQTESTFTETPRDPGRAIQELERRCRALGRVAWMGLLIGAFAVAVLVLQRVGERGGPIKAQGFVLEDFEGNVRASLELHGGESEVRLSLNDDEGRTRILAFVGSGGFPMLQLRDLQGRARAGMGVLPDGAPVLVLNGPDGQPQVSLRGEGVGEGGRLIVRAGAEGEDFSIPPREGGR